MSSSASNNTEVFLKRPEAPALATKPHGRQSKRFPLLPGNRWSKNRRRNSGGGARITEAGEAVLEASAALNKVRNQILTDIQGGESPKLAALASVALRMSIRNIIPA